MELMIKIATRYNRIKLMIHNKCFYESTKRIKK